MHGRSWFWMMAGLAMALGLDLGCGGGEASQAAVDPVDAGVDDGDDADATDADLPPDNNGGVTNNGEDFSNGESPNNGQEDFGCDWTELHTIGPDLVQTAVATLGQGERRLEALADIDGDETYEFVTSKNQDGWQLSGQDGGALGAGGEGKGVLDVTVCDLDADGRDDLLVTEVGMIVALRSRGDGTFEERRFLIQPPGGLVAGCGDVNGDGVTDVVYGTTLPLRDPDSDARGHLGVLLGRPGFAFAPGPFTVEPDEQTHPWKIVAIHVADVDGDGVLDVVSAGSRGDVAPAWDVVVVQRGLGDGRFAWARLSVLEGLNNTRWADVSADVTGDGRPDLLACTDAGCAVAVWRADGSFGAPMWLPNVDEHGPSPSLVAADLDGDGLMDLAGTDYRALRVGLWRGTTEGFAPPTRLLDLWGRKTTVLGDLHRQRLWVKTTHEASCTPECEADAACADGVCTLGFCSECYTAASCLQGTCERGRCHECDVASDCGAGDVCIGQRCLQTVSSEAGWMDVSIAAQTGCGLREDGEVRCWGLAAPAPSGRFVKVEVSPGGGWYACAIGEDQQLACWGPGWTVGPPPLAAALDVVAQSSFACALDLEGEAACWPINTVDPPEGILAAAPLAGPFTQLAASEGTVCGLRPDGEVSCWSCDAAGEGRCAGVVEGEVPQGPFVAVSAGTTSACALRADGTAVCWGHPALAPDRRGSYRDLDVRDIPAVFVTEAGGLEVFGGEATWSEELLRSESPFVRASTGGGAVCAVREDGRLQCVGSELSVP